MEAGEHAHADEDEDGAHDDRSEDAPEEHAVLPLGRHLEEGEDHDEHEYVVHAQAELDEVRGEELLAELGAAPEVDEDVEGQRQGGPDGAPAQRLFHLHLMGIALEHAEIERQHGGDEREETGPGPPRERRKCVNNAK